MCLCTSLQGGLKGAIGEVELERDTGLRTVCSGRIAAPGSVRFHPSMSSKTASSVSSSCHDVEVRFQPTGTASTTTERFFCL